jgi:hypothetical protein
MAPNVGRNLLSLSQPNHVDRRGRNAAFGTTLITLRDAALYTTKLPNAEHEAPEWQAAMEALLLVAEHGGPTMFARIGVMCTLNRHVDMPWARAWEF